MKYVQLGIDASNSKHDSPYRARLSGVGTSSVSGAGHERERSGANSWNCVRYPLQTFSRKLVPTGEVPLVTYIDSPEPSITSERGATSPTLRATEPLGRYARTPVIAL
jgi:hypothetical protein